MLNHHCICTRFLSVGVEEEALENEKETVPNLWVISAEIVVYFLIEQLS